MKRLMLLAMFAVGCADRPLTPCASGVDCAATEWCVQGWGSHGTPSFEATSGVCAEQCSSDADCAMGTCAVVGSGATSSLAPKYFACRE